MPNWCDNLLSITGTKKDRDALRKFVKSCDSEFSCNKIVPEPPEVVESAKNDDSITPLWYEWRHEHWGVKWDVNNVEVGETEDALIYSFDTPWGPPSAAIHKLSVIFPNVVIDHYFSEPGEGFSGNDIYKEGIIDSHGGWDTEKFTMGICSHCGAVGVISNDEFLCKECMNKLELRL